MRIRTLFSLLLVFILIWILNGGCNSTVPDDEAIKILNIDYKYQISGDISYDIFPEDDYSSLELAYKKAYIKIEVNKPGGFPSTDSYPRYWDDLVWDISTRMPNENPWYLESGIAPEDDNDWCSQDYYGFALMDLPYYSFSLVFTGKICDEFNNAKVAAEMVAIHEMGHQYGHLSDKYLSPWDHDICTDDPCCIMDQLYSNMGYVIEWYDFCSKCIDSLRKVNWEY